LVQAVKVWLVDQGNGPLWQYGTSDWSGNHLILHGLLVPWLVSHQVGDGHQGEMTKAMRNAMEKMRSTRLGLFQLVTATLSGLSPLPPEVEEALWVLREFPAPKEHHEHDWRLDPQFCMSPFPALPWKADWESTYRFQGIHAWPAFERDHDVFAFRSNPMSFEGAASPLQDFGVDYLFAYWFGRYFKVIQPGM
jgi:hypothetical protein